MPTSSLFQFPDTAALLANIGNISTPFFNNLLSIAVFIIGFAIGGYVILIIIHAVSGVFHMILNGIAARNATSRMKDLNARMEKSFLSHGENFYDY